MITSINAVNILYVYITTSDLLIRPEKPNGGLYKYQRPFDSQLEDIVINSLPMNREQLQEGILNVNIHVPNVGTGNQSQPNTARLNELTEIVSELINEVWHEKADYMFSVQQDNLFKDTDGSWYANIRVEFRSVNI